MNEAFELLNALSEAVDELHRHGYELYIRTKAVSWTNRRNMGLSDKPYRLLIGNAIQPTKDRALVFGLMVGWSNEDWHIEATIEEEWYEPELPIKCLWEQTDSGTGIAEFREALAISTHDLMAQTASDWFLKFAQLD
jgi:hypothetical protein